ncbi:type VII secretion integral membrane protein EccD [Actinoallomurus bryophytorum]|uniref:Type VII secretion integral membrane protein EccD n=1 Tax=Actinoallomurus bryophytorum TaxID=1490222 RepID=A0A543CGW6_9ACTN|nr:type VII secretion integral membrane protein EccD [Actinoallomurus bryophytorum]TQL96342.1 type VII secretion integral membrane protein EccD [Actinoallomurus bryophytorum]
MSPRAGADLCRITIVAPGRRIDLSLPAEVPLVQMLPTLLRASGREMADAGLAHSGWVLQRLDGPPLENGLSLTQLDIHDGEVLYFRPRMTLIPELVYDDVADVVATGKNDRADRWRTETTRRFGLFAGAAALILGVVPILASGPPWRPPAVAAAIVALALVILGSALSRAVGDSTGGAALGYAALPYAFLAGLLVPARAELPLLDVGAPHLLAAFAATTVVAVLAGFGVADGLPWFVGIGFAGVVGTISGGITLAFDGIRPAGVAAGAAVIVVGLSALIPTLSFRLARVPLPSIPTSAEDLRSEVTVIDGKALLHRAASADRFATGLVAGIALVAAVALLFLAFSPGKAGPSMAAVLSLSLLLRARIFRGRSQRSWMLVVGLGGLGLLDIGLSLRGTPAQTLVLVLPLILAVAAIALTMAMWLPGHRPTPFWGRAGDIVDMIAIVSLVPLALAVLRVYSKVRGLSG